MENLPTKIFEEIFKDMSYEDINQCKKVCLRWTLGMGLEVGEPQRWETPTSGLPTTGVTEYDGPTPLVKNCQSCP